MKFGGSSVADPDKIKHVARRLVEARERGVRVVATVSAMGDTTDGLLVSRARGLARAASTRARHAPLHRRAHRLRARRDGGARPRLRGRLVHRLAGRDHHRPRSHEGEDPRDHTRARGRSARPGEDRPRRRLSGVLARHDGRDDARTGRHRCDRSCARRCPRCVLRDLLRRRRRLHRRSADRPRRPQARQGVVRGDARDGGVRGEGAHAARRRARARARRARPRAVDLLDGAGNVDRGRRQTSSSRSSRR